MNILNKALKIAKAAIDEAAKPESFDKGEDFENYIQKYLFPKEKYDIVHQTQDYVKNKDRYVETTKLPDFMFKSKDTKKQFYIEAKFRSSYFDDSIEWGKEYQLKRYLEINKETPVFIVIGVGGSAGSPKEIFVVPIKHIKYTKLFKSVLKKFEFKTKQIINPHQLWRLL